MEDHLSKLEFIVACMADIRFLWQKWQLHLSRLGLAASESKMVYVCVERRASRSNPAGLYGNPGRIKELSKKLGGKRPEVHKSGIYTGTFDCLPGDPGAGRVEGYMPRWRIRYQPEEMACIGVYTFKNQAAVSHGLAAILPKTIKPSKTLN